MTSVRIMYFTSLQMGSFVPLESICEVVVGLPNKKLFRQISQVAGGKATLVAKCCLAKTYYSYLMLFDYTTKIHEEFQVPKWRY